MFNAMKHESDRYKNEKRKREDEKYDRTSSDEEYRRSKSPPHYERRNRDEYRRDNRYGNRSERNDRYDRQERKQSRYSKDDRREKYREKQPKENEDDEYNPEKPFILEKQDKKPNEKQMNFPKRNSDTLGLDNIPNELNTIDKLNGHFKKFGTVVNITVKPEKNKAFVQFTSNDEAYKAFSSPEAVLENRFIKVFWAKPRQKETPKEPVKEPQPVLIKIPTQIPKKEEKSYDQRMKDFKDIVSKIEKMPDGEEKLELTKKLKMLMEMEQKKEEKKEVTLKLEIPTKPKPTWVPRSSLKIDKRTSTVEIKNIPIEKLNQESVKQHFQKYSIKDISFEGTICFVTFEDRKTAEIAISKGKMMESVKLDIQFKVDKKEISNEKKPDTPVEVEEYQVERRERPVDDETEKSWKR